MKTIFVSSTVWDLVDVRAEVYEFLSRNGYRPLMSEKDGFLDDLEQDGSYEKCRKAVVACDIFLMLINNRYGGSRNPSASEISITHQEFRWAVELRKDFMCLVRDKVETDMKTWKDNNKAPAVKLGYVTGEKNLRVFGLLAEVQTSAIDGGALWWRPFVDSVDLKRQIGVKLGINDFSNHYLAQAQSLQALPRVIFHVKTGQFEPDGRIKNGVDIHNVGSGAAVDIEVLLIEAGQVHCTRKIKSLGTDKPTSFDLVYPRPGKLNTAKTADLVFRYKNILGSAFETRYLLDCSAPSTTPHCAETHYGSPL